MARYRVVKSRIRGCFVVLDRARGYWYVCDKASGMVLDYGRTRKMGWSFYMGEE